MTDNVIAKIELEIVRRRQGAYARTFSGPVAEHVLQDLAQFCHFTDSGYHPDRRMSDVIIGRREVFTRILNQLNLSPEELYGLATMGQPDAYREAARKVQLEESDE